MPDSHAGGSELPSAAGHRRDPQADRAPRRGHIHLRALDRFCEGYRQREFERVAVAMKLRLSPGSRVALEPPLKTKDAPEIETEEQTKVSDPSLRKETV